MSREVRGVSLKSLSEPINFALKGFQEISNASVRFDLDRAPLLELTPDKPNAARSATPFFHNGEEAGTLFVIAFAPEDGTGDESAFKTSQVRGQPGWVPLIPKVMPRSKQSMHSEVSLSLVSQNVYSRHTSPVVYAGDLALVGINQQYELVCLGHLGQPAGVFVEAKTTGNIPEPTATRTVGSTAEFARFGDPHAVYNYYPAVLQVAGFLAISNDQASRHGRLHEDLRAKLPQEFKPVESPVIGEA